MSYAFRVNEAPAGAVPTHQAMGGAATGRAGVALAWSTAAYVGDDGEPVKAICSVARKDGAECGAKPTASGRCVGHERQFQAFVNDGPEAAAEIEVE